MHNFFQILIFSMLTSWRSIYRGNSDNSEKKIHLKFESTWEPIATQSVSMVTEVETAQTATDLSFSELQEKKYPFQSARKSMVKNLNFLYQCQGAKAGFEKCQGTNLVLAAVFCADCKGDR